MKVRYKDKRHITGTASAFNLHSVGEVIVQLDDGDATSEYQRELQVYLEGRNEWMDMNAAFKAGHLITDDFNTCFFQATDELSECARPLKS